MSSQNQNSNSRIYNNCDSKNNTTTTASKKHQKYENCKNNTTTTASKKNIKNMKRVQTRLPPS